MFQAMPLEYFKADGLNNGDFKMTQNDPNDTKTLQQLLIMIKNV